MNSSKLDGLPDDALFRIERKIAQRADELSHGIDRDGRDALEYWRQAEREVWDGADRMIESCTGAAAGHLAVTR